MLYFGSKFLGQEGWDYVPTETTLFSPTGPGNLVPSSTRPQLKFCPDRHDPVNRLFVPRTGPFLEGGYLHLPPSVDSKSFPSFPFLPRSSYPRVKEEYDPKVECRVRKGHSSVLLEWDSFLRRYPEKRSTGSRGRGDFNL